MELEGERELLGLVEALGLIEALGETDTENDCIQINQLVEDKPDTFLNSKISPKTLPLG